MLTGMNKQLGGRGKKAPYETTHVRVPVPIKPQIEALIEQFKSGESESSENPLTSIDEAVILAKSILTQKKSARVSLQKLLTGIYGVEITL